MGKLVFIVGNSGSGKSTSLRNLNPDNTGIINSDAKPLPFKGFQKNYNAEKKNYRITSDSKTVLETLKIFNENKSISTIVVDTWSRIMTDAIMNPRFRQQKGFDKWSVFASQQYDLIDYINNHMREDIKVYLFAHPVTEMNDEGYTQTKIGVQGKMIDKLVPESFSSIVLYTELIRVPNKPVEYKFRTQTNGFDSAKSPINLFEEELIDNDLVLVNNAIDEYYK